MTQTPPGWSRAVETRPVVLRRTRWVARLAAVYFACPAVFAAFDAFGELRGSAMFDLPRRADARSHTTITLRDLEALPQALRGERAALLLVQTDQGNLAKMLVSAGYRKQKPAERNGDLVPVLVVERFETLNAGDRQSFAARGKDVVLFDGFQFDLDAGQVVPEGMGGDLVFSGRAPEGPNLAAVGKSQLFTFEKPLPALGSGPGKPSSGRAVQPADFTGRYFLVANGQWSGSLELAVDPAGTVTGHYRSDLNGSVYPVAGKVSTAIPQKVEFSIQYPRAKQSFEGLLWTEGKSAIAGTVTLLEHPYSFIAIREGASLAPESVALEPKPIPSQLPTYRIVVLAANGDRCRLDGKELSLAELSDALGKAAQAEPGVKVLLRTPASMPYDRLHQLINRIQAAGITAIRLAPAAEKNDVD